MKKKIKITEEQAQKILKLNEATQQAPNPCNQFISQVVPSQGGGGDIDCCKMLNGDMVGPYGNTAGSQMLQTHCDVAWSMAVMGGTFNDGNQLGTSLAWADCCKGSSINDNPCPPTDKQSPFYTNHNEFCANCGPGAYYYNHVDCPCCDDDDRTNTTQTGDGCPDIECKNPNHVQGPAPKCKCECPEGSGEKGCKKGSSWSPDECCCVDKKGICVPDNTSPVDVDVVGPLYTENKTELSEEINRINKLIK